MGRHHRRLLTDDEVAVLRRVSERSKARASTEDRSQHVRRFHPSKHARMRRAARRKAAGS